MLCKANYLWSPSDLCYAPFSIMWFIYNKQDCEWLKEALLRVKGQRSKQGTQVRVWSVVHDPVRPRASGW